MAIVKKNFDSGELYDIPSICYASITIYNWRWESFYSWFFISISNCCFWVCGEWRMEKIWWNIAFYWNKWRFLLQNIALYREKWSNFSEILLLIESGCLFRKEYCFSLNGNRHFLFKRLLFTQQNFNFVSIKTFLSINCYKNVDSVQ